MSINPLRSLRSGSLRSTESGSGYFARRENSQRRIRSQTCNVILAKGSEGLQDGLEADKCATSHSGLIPEEKKEVGRRLGCTTFSGGLSLSDYSRELHRSAIV